jgi:hypothetical protein
MLQHINIYQIYFKEELKSFLDEGFIPLDNTENKRPDLREWYTWNEVYNNPIKDNLTHWGFFSWKFKQKTNLNSNQVFTFIQNNPGYEVYLFNPCILNEACFINPWEQGDLYHPNISDIGNTFLKKIGYKSIDVKTLNIDKNIAIFANFIVGSKLFWDKFMLFTHKLFTEAEKDENFKVNVFSNGLSNYSYDKSLPNFTFLIERLLPTFIYIENIKCKTFQYSKDIVLPKYLPYYEDIHALSELKVLINKYQSEELYGIWNYYRHKFLHMNPGILNLE